jgi:HD superfamily phosphodiesterase
MTNIGQVANAMITYYAGDVRRINHFLKVHGFAKTIGELEGLNESVQEILEIAALTHDIGIKNSEKKHSSSAGNYQQIEGPPEAKRLLESLGIASEVIDRVCWLIAHHHTYKDIQDRDYQMLVEADFLVNAFEDNMSKASIISFMNKVFVTDTGMKLLKTMFEL